MRVSFVVAPVLSVARPALGVSLLKACLARAGVESRIHYANLSFAAQEGLEWNEFLAERIPADLLAGEWIFSRTNSVRKYAEKLRQTVDAEIVDRLMETRRRAGEFLAREVEKIAAYGADIVGFSSSFQQSCASLAMASMLKRMRPAVVTCFGGANCESPMGEALRRCYPQIDHVFSGEAEETFVAFVTSYARGAVRPTLNVMDSTQRANHFVDLDQQPVPDFSDYFEGLRQAEALAPVEVSLPFEASRGCWWGAKHHCTFCGLNGGALTYRSKSAGKVLEELRILRERWGIDRFSASDNILNPGHIPDVLAELDAQGSSLELFFEIKANTTLEQLRTMARAGVSWVQPGIESLDDELLQKLEKGVSLLLNLRLLRSCAEVGMRAGWNLLTGIPGESDEQYENIVALIPKIEHLEPPDLCVPIRIDRYSPYFERPEEFGFRGMKPAWAYEHIFDVAEAERVKLAYFFHAECGATAGAEVLARLKAGVDEWRGRFHQASAPTLFAAKVQQGTLVVDTRSCAKQRMRMLSACEADLLATLRDPVRYEFAEKQLGAKYDAGSLRAAYAELLGAAYVVASGGKALSVVTEKIAS